MGWRVEVEGEVLEVEGILGVFCLVGFNGLGEAGVSYVAPRTDYVAGYENRVVRHFGGFCC